MHTPLHTKRLCQTDAYTKNTSDTIFIMPGFMQTLLHTKRLRQTDVYIKNISDTLFIPLTNTLRRFSVL